MLFRLSRELLQSESVAALVELCARRRGQRHRGRCEACCICSMATACFRPAGDGCSPVEMPHLRQLALSVDRAQAGRRAADSHPHGRAPKGLLRLRGVCFRCETAEAMGSLISISIERAQASKSVARGEAAKESERLRTLMIDSITHELRTPLTSIKGAATTLLGGDVSSSDTTGTADHHR